MGLRDKAANGAVWTSIGTIGGGLLYFLLTMILARVLTPADFGLVQLLSVFTIISEAFIDSGFGQAVIRDHNASRLDLSSVFYFNLLIAIVLYAILFFFAPIIANFYNEPKIVPLSRYVFLTIVFYACSIIQNANFDRTLNFRPQAVATVLSIILAGALSLFLAFSDYGVWALATYLVSYAFIKMVLFWVFSKWKPILKLSTSSIKRYFRFGSNLLIQGIIDNIVSNLESLLIGKFYTQTDLGYVSQGQKADSYIAQKATSVIKKVTYPILSHLHAETGDIKQGYRRVLGLTMFFIIPLMSFSIAASDNLLFCLFGEQWLPSVPYMRLACICGLSTSFYSVFFNLFYVKDKTRLFLKISMIRQSLRVIVLVTLVNVSIIALMYGAAGVAVISAIMYSYFGGELIHYSLKEMFNDLWRIILISVISSLIIYFIPFFIPISNRLLLIIIQLVIMLVTYLLGAKILNITPMNETKEILISYVKKLKIKL